MTGRAHSIPLIHISDLYHPPQDPDDHVDLATVFALEEYDIRAIILDASSKFLEPAPSGFDIARDPGSVPVRQMMHLTGRSAPVATGPLERLGSPDDALRDVPPSQRRGVELVLDVLNDSHQPVTISIVGSARALAVAYNTDGQLVKRRTKRVLLNAGSSGGSHIEWNVGLDPSAYTCLWHSGLSIDWFPCTTENSPFDPHHKHSAYFSVEHRNLFEGLSSQVLAWFCYGFSASSAEDPIDVLDRHPSGQSWEDILNDKRSMWATASLIVGAGRHLSRINDDWRFVRKEKREDDHCWPMSLEGITASISDGLHVSWTHTGDTASRIFTRQEGDEFGKAMGAALNSLLRTL
ncbi:MAG: hypothetical protein HKN43_11895 [Rhodothermales bacterium]|nr:hypothetical protein [Rhodothermales bacterium]